MGPPRSLAGTLRAGFVLGLLAWAGHSAGQDRPRLRPRPLPEASNATAAASNSLSDPAGVGAPAVPSPVPPAAGSPVVRPALPPAPPLVLRSAVRSRYSHLPVIARSTAGQCRAQCAGARARCAGGEADASGCDPAWTQCLSACDGLSYSRGP